MYKILGVVKFLLFVLILFQVDDFLNNSLPFLHYLFRLSLRFALLGDRFSFTLVGALAVLAGLFGHLNLIYNSK